MRRITLVPLVDLYNVLLVIIKIKSNIYLILVI